MTRIMPVPARNRRLLTTVLSVWTWIEIALVCIVGCTLHWFVFALTYPFDRRRLISGRFYRLIAVTAIRFAPMWSFRHHGLIPRRIRGRTVVVSNHVSHLDSFLISSLPWEMKWLGKRSLYRIPFVGWNMWLTGDIPVIRGNSSSVAAAMQKCGAYLRQDVPVCIFPEGTRATGGELLPFKDGAFRLAIENGADILPLAVAGTQQGLPKHSWQFDFTRGVVTVGQPISTAGMQIDQVGQLKEQVRAQILTLLAQIQTQTP
jgi:1-acyl-sn-glycerol-3-phosphate acyltransferase